MTTVTSGAGPSRTASVPSQPAAPPAPALIGVSEAGGVGEVDGAGRVDGAGDGARLDGVSGLASTGWARPASVRRRASAAEAGEQTGPASSSARARWPAGLSRRIR